MLCLAVCDPDLSLHNQFQKIFGYISWKRNIRIRVCYYSTGKCLLAAKDDSYDALIVNPKLPDMSGIDVARTFKSNDSKISILFLADNRDMVLEGYEVLAYRYYIKEDALPCLHRYTEDLIDRIIKEYAIIPLTLSGVTRRIEANTIICVKRRANRLVLVTKDGDELLTNKKLAEMEPMLTDYGFLRVHRSCMINIRYLDRIKNSTVFLTTGTDITASRERIESIRNAIQNCFTTNADTQRKYGSPPKMEIESN